MPAALIHMVRDARGSVASPWRRVLPFLALAAATLCSVLLVEGAPGSPLATRRLGVLMFLGAGALAPFLGGRPRTWRLLGEFLVLALGGLACMGVGLSAGLRAEAAAVGALLVSAGWSLGWTASLLTRGLGLGWAAPPAGLLVVGMLSATPFVAPVRGGALPAWAVNWNPVLRLHWHLEGTDWFQVPMVYRVTDGAYAAYPTGAEPAGLVAGVVGGSFLIVLGLSWIQKARRGLFGGDGALAAQDERRPLSRSAPIP